MIFNTHQLPNSLSPYVEAIFHYKDFVPDHSVERLVPTGHIFILFELDGITRNTFDNETLQPNALFEKVWISGAHKNYISISAHEQSEMLVIQLKPYGAHPFFHFPIEELNEQIISTKKYFGHELTDLRDKFMKATDSKEMFALAEQWLQSRFNAAKCPPDSLIDFYSKLQASSKANYTEIVQEYPTSQKQLITHFKKFVGLTPKYSHRILRFNEILQKIHQKEMISWAQVAYCCGFSDQSYFIKEFKHFSGFNPEEFIKQDFNQGEPNFFPLDRRG